MLEPTKDPLDDVVARVVTPPRRNAATVTAVVVAVVAVALAGLTACGGSSKPKATATSTASAPTSAASSTGGAVADAATIKDVYLRFLDLKIPVEQKVDLIQDGTEFLPAMQAEAKNPQAATVSLQVSDVKVTSAKLAEVTYTILVSGSPLLPNQHGYAVNEDGKWKIAGVTFCGLLAAQSPTAIPPVCSKPAATSLPTA